jgi:hypothetical protein
MEDLRLVVLQSKETIQVARQRVAHARRLYMELEVMTRLTQAVLSKCVEDRKARREDDKSGA